MGMIDPKPKWTGSEITGRIRGAVKERLEQYFAEFLNCVPRYPTDSAASPEEQRFLLDVFELWESIRGRNDGEVYIATAFQIAIERQEPCVIHVSEKLAGNVKSFIRWLKHGGTMEGLDADET